jgi:hypothetical protein
MVSGAEHFVPTENSTEPEFERLRESVSYRCAQVSRDEIRTTSSGPFTIEIEKPRYRDHQITAYRPPRNDW